MEFEWKWNDGISESRRTITVNVISEYMLIYRWFYTFAYSDRQICSIDPSDIKFLYSCVNYKLIMASVYLYSILFIF